ncbi:hypothetical protein [Bacillus marinisedimentorum]|uniref:hypothetical protein n=1 Tax=Bacillus marinisedimentorum TaxID=1821260 RepID=UPI001B808386|nr:hypothetical protein [Bacillus marinisedimentorum]
MIVRLFIFLIGFGLSVAGGITAIAYLNLLTAGHGFIEYLDFISRQIETYFLGAGMLLIVLSIYMPLD